MIVIVTDFLFSLIKSRLMQVPNVHALSYAKLLLCFLIPSAFCQLFSLLREQQWVNNRKD